MSNVKHSKFSNTGILFELLVRTITSDTLSGNESEAMNILRKYFNKTELGKEYKLYEIITKKKHLTEGKAEIIINSVIDASKNLNRGILKRQKYNLIKEISDKYDINHFFKTKIPNYKTYAAIYTLFEIYNGDNKNNLEQIIENKTVILENLTSNVIDKTKVENGILNEFQNYDKDLRILTYKMMLEKFNDRYDNFNSNQKIVLKEFINSIDSTSKLKEFYNGKITEIKKQLLSHIKNIDDQVVKIKLNEINNLINPIVKNKNINNNDLVNLLQYYELLEEISKVK